MVRIRKCLVLGCNNNERNSKVSFFSLPTSNLDRLKTWLTILNRSEMLSIRRTTLTHFRVCSDHFDKSSFRTPERKRLNINAVPILTGTSNKQPLNNSNIAPGSDLSLISQLSITKAAATSTVNLDLLSSNNSNFTTVDLEEALSQTGIYLLTNESDVLSEQTSPFPPENVVHAPVLLDQINIIDKKDVSKKLVPHSKKSRLQHKKVKCKDPISEIERRLDRRLLSQILQHRCIYDITCSNFNNVEMKNRVWEEIGLSMRSTGEFIKKRWLVLLNKYTKDISNENTIWNNNEGAVTSEQELKAEPEEIDENTDIRFELLEEARHTQHRASISKPLLQVQTTPVHTHIKASISEPSLQVHTTPEKSNLPASSSDNCIPSLILLKSLKNQQCTGRKVSTEDPLCTSVNYSKKDLADPDFTFAYSVCKHLKTLDKDRKEQAKEQITNILMQHTKNDSLSRTSL